MTVEPTTPPTRSNFFCRGVLAKWYSVTQMCANGAAALGKTTWEGIIALFLARANSSKRNNLHGTEIKPLPFADYYLYRLIGSGCHGALAGWLTQEGEKSWVVVDNSRGVVHFHRPQQSGSHGKSDKAPRFRENYWKGVKTSKTSDILIQMWSKTWVNWKNDDRTLSHFDPGETYLLSIFRPFSFWSAEIRIETYCACYDN